MMASASRPCVGVPLKAALALRHWASLLELGRVAEAEQGLGVVLAVYRERWLGGLELAKALRAAALAQEAAGEPEVARGLWSEARTLYAVRQCGCRCLRM